jgi:hypothetical protein
MMMMILQITYVHDSMACCYVWLGFIAGLATIVRNVW